MRATHHQQLMQNLKNKLNFNHYITSAERNRQWQTTEFILNNQPVLVGISEKLNDQAIWFNDSSGKQIKLSLGPHGTGPYTAWNTATNQRIIDDRVVSQIISDLTLAPIIRHQQLMQNLKNKLNFNHYITSAERNRQWQTTEFILNNQPVLVGISEKLNDQAIWFNDSSGKQIKLSLGPHGTGPYTAWNTATNQRIIDDRVVSQIISDLTLAPIIRHQQSMQKLKGQLNFNQCITSAQLSGQWQTTGFILNNQPVLVGTSKTRHDQAIWFYDRTGNQIKLSLGTHGTGPYTAWNTATNQRIIDDRVVSQIINDLTSKTKLALQPMAAPPQHPYAQPMAAPPQHPYAQPMAAPPQHPYAQPMAAPPQHPYAQPMAAPPQHPYAQPMAAPPQHPYTTRPQPMAAARPQPIAGGYQLDCFDFDKTMVNEHFNAGNLTPQAQDIVSNFESYDMNGSANHAVLNKLRKSSLPCVVSYGTKPHLIHKTLVDTSCFTSPELSNPKTVWRTVPSSNKKDTRPVLIRNDIYHTNKGPFVISTLVDRTSWNRLEGKNQQIILASQLIQERIPPTKIQRVTLTDDSLKNLSLCTQTKLNAMGAKMGNFNLTSGPECFNEHLHLIPFTQQRPPLASHGGGQPSAPRANRVQPRLSGSSHVMFASSTPPHHRGQDDEPARMRQPNPTPL